MTENEDMNVSENYPHMVALLRKELDALRKELDKRVTLQVETYEQCQRLEKENERLKKREHIPGCYEVYGDCTCVDLHEQIKAQLQQESNRHLKYLSDANKEVEHQKNLKEAFEKHSWELADRDRKIIETLTSQARELFVVFERFSKHDATCRRSSDHPNAVYFDCSCGLESALRAYRTQSLRKKESTDEKSSQDKLKVAVEALEKLKNPNILSCSAVVIAEEALESLRGAV